MTTTDIYVIYRTNIFTGKRIMLDMTFKVKQDADDEAWVRNQLDIAHVYLVDVAEYQMA